jgi:hypothetical protein
MQPFLVQAESLHPKSTSPKRLCELQGGWQIPLHLAPPSREDATFHGESLADTARVTCASLLIRIMRSSAARALLRRKPPAYGDRYTVYPHAWPPPCHSAHARTTFKRHMQGSCFPSRTSVTSSPMISCTCVV